MICIMVYDNDLLPLSLQANVWIHADNIVNNYPYRIKLQWNWNQKKNVFIQENAYDYVICKIVVILLRSESTENIN